MNLAAARFCRLADMVMDSSTGKESDTYIRKHYYDCRPTSQGERSDGEKPPKLK